MESTIEEEARELFPFCPLCNNNIMIVTEYSVSVDVDSYHAPGGLTCSITCHCRKCGALFSAKYHPIMKKFKTKW